METQTMEIDFEVYKLVEQERRSFAESQNDALRRLLGLKDRSRNGVADRAQAATGVPWSGKGVTLPHGTELEMEYRGRVHRGTIDNGEWLVDGVRFSSPSAAAGGVATTKSGTRPSLDGWQYWRVRRPGETKWTALAQLRVK